MLLPLPLPSPYLLEENVQEKESTSEESISEESISEKSTNKRSTDEESTDEQSTDEESTDEGSNNEESDEGGDIIKHLAQQLREFKGYSNAKHKGQAQKHILYHR